MRYYLMLVAVLLTFSVSKICSQDNEAKIKEGIYKVYDMFSSGDFAGIENYIDPGYVEHSPSPTGKKGLEGLKEVINMVRKGFSDVKFTVNDVIISGNKAVVLNTMSGTNNGEFMGMPATNKKVSVMEIDWLIFKDGKCTEHWGYGDDMGMMQQLGISK